MRHSSTLLYTVALMLSACGGGGGGASSPGPGPAPAAPLAISSATPDSGAASGIDAVPTIAFNQAPDMATVSGASVTLNSPIGAVGGRLALSGNNLTLTPTQPLVWGTHYQLNVAATLRGAGGGGLSAPYSAGFDTRMPAWGAVRQATPRVSYMGKLKTGGAANGDVLAVWPQMAPNSVVQMASARYTAASQSWSTPALIQANNKQADGSGLSVNRAGDACAVWEERQDNGNYAIMAARYNAAARQWSVPVAVSKPGEYSSQYSKVAVAINEAGNIIVAWKQYHNTDPKQATIDAAYYDAAARQWTPARSMQNGLRDTNFPVVAVDGGGNALVLWSQDGPLAGIQLTNAARYEARSRTWGASTPLTSSATESSSPVRLAFDGDGNAIATLSMSSTTSTGSTHAMRYNAAANSWGKPELLHNRHAGATLAVDAAGNALLAWFDYTGAAGFRISSRRYLRSSDSWSALPDLAGYATGELPLVFDPAGNAVTAWVSYDKGVYTMSAMRYNAAAGKWDAPALITTATGGMDTPTLGMDQSGSAMLLWPQHVDLFSSPAQVAYSRLGGR